MFWTTWKLVITRLVNIWSNWEQRDKSSDGCLSYLFWMWLQWNASVTWIHLSLGLYQLLKGLPIGLNKKPCPIPLYFEEQRVAEIDSVPGASLNEKAVAAMPEELVNFMCLHVLSPEKGEVPKAILIISTSMPLSFPSFISSCFTTWSINSQGAWTLTAHVHR